MKALVLEKKLQLSIRDIDIQEQLGVEDVRIKITNVGICGSDLHYYLEGALGFRVVKEPVVLGHEASGIISEVGQNVKTLKVGDRVCMEPQVPNLNSKASRLGMYNLDPLVRFWGAPPVHGCLRESVVHPAMFTFKLPPNVSLTEGAMVEPFAIGLFAATIAKIKPGDVAMVFGAGTIGLVTALAAKIGGCSKVIITDVIVERLNFASKFGFIPVNIAKEKLSDVVQNITQGWGADIIFEASGSESAISGIFETICPGGKVVLIGVPRQSVPINIYLGMAKGVHIETVFRYAHMFPKAIALIESGAVDLKPLLTRVFPFERAVEAFEYAAQAKTNSVKTMIELQKSQ
jgi:D-xylulose reductase